MSQTERRMWVLRRVGMGEASCYFMQIDPNGEVGMAIAPQDARKFPGEAECLAFIATHPVLQGRFWPAHVAPKPITCDFCGSETGVVKWFGCADHGYTVEEQVYFLAQRGVQMLPAEMSDIEWFDEWGACAVCAPLVEIGPQALMKRALAVLREEQAQRRMPEDYFRCGKAALEMAHNGFWKHRQPEKDGPA